ncbi:YolD-like family protein [Campylobacter concisus]|nr:YolD-like family protein [Campylobacter concisus]MBE9819027.1 YolD-like family protein [Campylobacter concisus]
MRSREREKCEKLELDESKVDEILKKISELRPADEVYVSYHDGYAYTSASGLISDVNFKNKTLMVVKTRIKFEDINDLKII